MKKNGKLRLLVSSILVGGVATAMGATVIMLESEPAKAGTQTWTRVVTVVDPGVNCADIGSADGKVIATTTDTSDSERFQTTPTSGTTHNCGTGGPALNGLSFYMQGNVQAVSGDARKFVSGFDRDPGPGERAKGNTSNGEINNIYECYVKNVTNATICGTDCGLEVLPSATGATGKICTFKAYLEAH